MSHQRLPPPDPAVCLIPRSDIKPKGGTFVAEGVVSLADHQVRLASGYRPAKCSRCGHGVLHVHDYRSRVALRAESCEVVRIVRFVCAASACGAIWQILPAFIARHLWHAWKTVETAAIPSSAPSDVRPVSSVPGRTVSRWLSRLGSSALFLVQLFAVQSGSNLEAFAQSFGFERTREELVVAFAVHSDARPGERLSGLAGLIHRLHPRTRLM